LNTKYETIWRKYAFPKNEAEFANEEDIKQYYPRFKPNIKGNIAGGLPVFVCNDGTSYVNTETEHSIIFGGTGSGKSRRLIAPLICQLAEAGDGGSMIITDVKGEFSTGSLSGKVNGCLDKNGYTRYFLDFRNMQSDSINILDYPYQLYRAGKEDLAGMEIDSIISTLASGYSDARDPFWHESASSFIKGLILLAFRLCPADAINMSTILSFCTYKGSEALETALSHLSNIKGNSTLTMLESVLSNPENTRRCVLSSSGQLIRSFTNNNKLCQMLSQSSFNLEDLLKPKVALFIILPDETSSYDNIAGLLIKQITSFLVESAYKTKNGMLEHRINFILDEFCNLLEPGNNTAQFGRALSAFRSRNIRYFLVAQGLNQLKHVYGSDADIILANTKNLYYLQSTDFTLLNHLSDTSGLTFDNIKEVPKPLLSVNDLQGLRKTRDATEVYIKTGDLQIVTNFPDIDSIEWLQQYSKARNDLPVYRQKPVNTWGPADLLKLLKKRTDKELSNLLNEYFG